MVLRRIVDVISPQVPPVQLVGRGLNRLYHSRCNLRSYNTTGVDVVFEDWDNLLILDGCRYDLFRGYAESRLPGRFEARRSRGSATIEFLRANFRGRRLYDTVYVTGNPQLYRFQSELDVAFHAVEHLWRDEGWDVEHDTVLPETVTEAAKRAAEEYPDKRLIVHYVQPHYPFITADFDSGGLSDEARSKPYFWHQLMLGEHPATPEQVWQAYADNLIRAIPSVRELMEVLQGRTVVTSDHGNMIGERSAPIPTIEWGHPPGIYTEELVRVPWLISDRGDRKAITERGARETKRERTGREVVEERLRQLGYKT